MWSVQMGDIHPRAAPFVVALSSLVLAFRAVNEGITNRMYFFCAETLSEQSCKGRHTTDA